MPMKSMRMPSDGTLLGGPEAVSPLNPEFCPGTTIYLGSEALQKLNIEALPPIGGTVMVQARCVVSAAHEEQVPGRGVQRRLELQITDMEMSGGKEKTPQEIIYTEDN